MPTSANSGISIKVTTEKDLRKLTKFFVGEVSVEPKGLSDDELLATLIGWYLRNMPRPQDFEFKSVLHAFMVRTDSLNRNGEGSMHKYGGFPARLTKGSRHTNGNVLTPNGITAGVLDDIAYRVSWITFLSQSIRHGFGLQTDIPFDTQQLFLSLLSDQVIIDAAIFTELRYMMFDRAESTTGAFPFDVEFEIARRGKEFEWIRPDFRISGWPQIDGRFGVES